MKILLYVLAAIGLLWVTRVLVILFILIVGYISAIVSVEANKLHWRHHENVS